jgi:hypothetical protein
VTPEQEDLDQIDSIKPQNFMDNSEIQSTQNNQKKVEKSIFNITRIEAKEESNQENSSKLAFSQPNELFVLNKINLGPKFKLLNKIDLNINNLDKDLNDQKMTIIDSKGIAFQIPLF